MGRSDPPEPAQRPAEPGPDVATFPASRWQRFFWPAAIDPQQTTALNVAMRWRIIGDLSDAALEAALARAIARHEILRTRFVQDGSELKQIVTEHGHMRLARIDLQRLPADKRDAEAERIAAQTAHEPFEPNAASLVRALFLRLSPTESILCLTLSRLIVDGWSINLIVDEIARDASADTPPRMIAVELHYGDYTLWQEQALRGEAALTEAESWRERLKSLPGAFSLAPDSSINPADADSIHSLALDRDASAAFEVVAHDLGVTTFQFGASILALALARVTGEARIAFSTEVASREEQMAEGIVGPLINLLPLVLRVDARETVAANITCAALDIRACLAGENVPFANLDLAQADRALLPKLHFVLQKSYISADDSADPNYGRFRLQSLQSLSTGALWDLNFFMVQRDGVWRLSVERKARLFRAETAHAFLDYWRETILAVLQNPQIAFQDLPAPCSELRRQARLAPARGAASPGHTPSPIASDAKPAIVALNLAQVYFPLGRALGEDIAFIDCPLETPQTPAPQRYFIDIARDCAAQVRAARPNGPYVMFGFCVAGALALETARLLRAEGHDVPLVVLCDTWRPGFREDLRGLERSIRLMQIRRALWAKHRAKLRSGEMNWSYVLRSWPFARALALADIAEWLGLIKAGPAQMRLDAENRVLADHLHDSQTRFRPKPYDGDVLIFRSEEVLTGRLFPRDFDWAKVLTGAVEVMDCPGQHDEMFRPAGVAVISAAIRAKLAALGVIAAPEATPAAPVGSLRG